MTRCGRGAGVLKDVPEAPLEMLRRPDQDSTRLALYPSLDYTGLYRALVQLFDIVPLLQYGVHGKRQTNVPPPERARSWSPFCLYEAISIASFVVGLPVLVIFCGRWGTF